MSGYRITLLILATTLLLGGCSTKELKEENEVLKVQLQQEEASQQQLRKDYDEQLESQQQLSDREQKKARSEIEALRLDLDEALRQNNIKVQKIENLTVIELGQTALFPSAQVSLTAEGKTVVKEIAATLNRYPGYYIRIEGHSDSLPLNQELKYRYISNWELSAIRAATVAKYMIYALDVPRTHISIAGYGDTRPIADNQTKEGRAKNRRIRAVIFKPRP
ncbi:MAG: flagellar motor protein MotB [Gammaproteobacteria bacterium]|nr:flagellar motor protein MotB [Gammaproteobacteria bacterium]